MSTLLWRLVPDVDAAFRRFPITVVLALLSIGVVLAIGGDHDLLSATNGFGPLASTVLVVFVLAITAILWSVAVELFADRRGWSLARRIGLCLAGGLFVIGLHVLPDVAPVLSARVLPANLWFLVWGTGFLALAATAAGYNAEGASIRIA